MTGLNRLSWVIILGVIVAYGSMGCGSSKAPSNPNSGNSGSDNPWTYTEHQYKIGSTSKSDGIDLNGDGTADNSVGALIDRLQTLAQQFGQSFDLYTQINTNITNGSTIIFLSVYAKDMQNSDKAMIWDFLGKSATEVDVTNGPANAYLSGSIASGNAKFGDQTSNLTIVIPLSTLNSILTIPIKSSICEFTVSSDNNSLTNGILAGAITQDDINTTILPAVVNIVVAINPSLQGVITTQVLQAMIQDSDYDLTINGQKAMSFAIGFTANAVTTPYTHPNPPSN